MKRSKAKFCRHFHLPRAAFSCLSAACRLLPSYWLVPLSKPVLLSILGAAAQALPAAKRAGKRTRNLMENWDESCRHTQPDVLSHW